MCARCGEGIGEDGDAAAVGVRDWMLSGERGFGSGIGTVGGVGLPFGTEEHVATIVLYEGHVHDNDIDPACEDLGRIFSYPACSLEEEVQPLRLDNQ